MSKHITLMGSPAQVGVQVMYELALPDISGIAEKIKASAIAAGRDPKESVFQYWTGVFSALSGALLHDLEPERAAKLLTVLSGSMQGAKAAGDEVLRAHNAAGGIDAVLSGDVGAGASASGKVVH